MKIIILFGPPGSGKGTQADILAKKLNYLHISTGDVLRNEIKSGSELGKKVEHIMKGSFASDEIMFQVMENFLEKNLDKNIIFDGFPRTVKQAEDFLILIEKFKIEDVKIINLEVHEKELLERLLIRAKEQNREDDNEETIRKRFQVFDELTIPCIEFFRKQKFPFKEIDGIGKIEEINEKVLSSI